MYAIKYCELCTAKLRVAYTDLHVECGCGAKYNVHFVATTPSLGTVAITLIR